MTRRLIITGSSGYIGTRLTALAQQQGHEVILLSRHTGNNKIAWQLGEPLPPLPHSENETALIHLAQDWKNQPGENNEEGALNLKGTETLLQSAREVGIKKFVFVSSQSARKDAPNIYGRVKWKIEQLLKGEDCVSARVGLVYGGPRIAMFGVLNKLVSKLPILPMLSPWRDVQPIHLNEVCQGLLALAEGPQKGWKGLAGPQPVSFGRFLRTLAREAHGQKIFILPVPLSLALFAAGITRHIPFIPTVDKERILGLAGTQPMACDKHVREIGLDILSLEEGLRRDPLGTRGLLCEARTVIAYVLGRPAPRLPMRLYVKAVRGSADSKGPMGLFLPFLKVPALLRFIEPLGAKSLLSKRLRLAAALVDASTEGHLHVQDEPSARLTKLYIQMALDVIALPFRLLATVIAR